MQNRSSKKPKRPRDINQLAYQIVQEATGQVPAQPEVPEDPIRAAAAELGRRGGLKGGKARAEKLTREERQRIARVAAKARWKDRQ
jgi:hypothetical protein